MEVNETAKMIFKLNEDYRGKTIKEIFQEGSEFGNLLKQASDLDERAWVKGDVYREEDFTTEYRGKLYTIDLLLIPQFDEKGNRKSMVVFGRDITDRKEQELILKQSKLLLENSNAILYQCEVNKTWSTIYVSENIDQLGLNKNDLLSGKYTLQDFVLKEDLLKAENDILQYMCQQMYTFPLEYRFKGPDGIERWIESNTKIELDDNGEPIHIQGVLMDITTRKRAEAELEENEKKLRLITENMNDLIIMIDLDGKINYASPSYKSVLGVEPSDYIGKSIDYILHEEDILKAKESFLGEEEVTKVAEFKKYKQNRRDFLEFEICMTPIIFKDNVVRGYVCVSREITERKKAESVEKELQNKLEYIAFHDSLTGVANRRSYDLHLEYFMDVMKHKQKPFAVILIDCDYFKKINDTMGHDVGDQYLIQFVRRVQNNIKDNDLVARIGGDEFVVLVSGTDIENEVIRIAENIITDIKKPWQIDQFMFNATTSMGIAIYSDEHKDKKTIMKEADAALYAAKNSGRGTFRMY